MRIKSGKSINLVVKKDHRMEILKSIKPEYLYIMASILIIIAYEMQNKNQFLYYIFGVLGFGVFIYAIVKHFKN